MLNPPLKKFYIEFVGSLQVRWGIELQAINEEAAKQDAIRSLPEDSNYWALGDGTNMVIDPEIVSVADLGTQETPDRDLGRLELEQKYTADGTHWVSHPVYVRDDWVKDVQNGDCEDGYWDWVYNSLQNEDVPDAKETPSPEE